LTGSEYPPEAGLLEQQGQAAPLAQDLCGHADVLEEPAHGVLRLQAQEVRKDFIRVQSPVTACSCRKHC